jgi:hypothetical protein
VRKRGFCLITPKKGAFLSDFVRFCKVLGFWVAFLSDFVGFELKAKKSPKTCV